MFKVNAVLPRAHFSVALACIVLSSIGTPAQAQVDPNRFLDTFESTFGKFEGFRRSGAKGICATGEFVGSADGRALSTSSAFSGQRIPVIIRFSVGGANPNAADNAKTQRNMALQFNLPNNEVWQMGNISAPIFGAATPEQFLGRLESLRPDPATKAPDPARVKAYADANPEVLLQGKYFAGEPVPASFAKVNYWGVHAFGFTDARGTKRWGKWVFAPVGGTAGLTDDEAKAKGPTFLAMDLRDRVKANDAVFDFNLQLAEAGDKIDSAVVPLPTGRKTVSLGKLRITEVAPDSTGACLNTTFIPTVLPKGVEASADPMLAARAAPYAVGLGRRLGEGAKQ
jgi:catalase